MVLSEVLHPITIENPFIQFSNHLMETTPPGGLIWNIDILPLVDSLHEVNVSVDQLSQLYLDTIRHLSEKWIGSGQMLSDIFRTIEEHLTDSYSIDFNTPETLNKKMQAIIEGVSRRIDNLTNIQDENQVKFLIQPIGWICDKPKMQNYNVVLQRIHTKGFNTLLENKMYEQALDYNRTFCQLFGIGNELNLPDNPKTRELLSHAVLDALQKEDTETAISLAKVYYYRKLDESGSYTDSPTCQITEGLFNDPVILKEAEKQALNIAQGNFNLSEPMKLARLILNFSLTNLNEIDTILQNHPLEEVTHSSLSWFAFDEVSKALPLSYERLIHRFITDLPEDRRHLSPINHLPNYLDKISCFEQQRMVCMTFGLTYQPLFTAQSLDLLRVENENTQKVDIDRWEELHSFVLPLISDPSYPQERWIYLFGRCTIAQKLIKEKLEDSDKLSYQNTIDLIGQVKQETDIHTKMWAFTGLWKYAHEQGDLQAIKQLTEDSEFQGFSYQMIRSHCSPETVTTILNKPKLITDLGLDNDENMRIGTMTKPETKKRREEFFTQLFIQIEKNPFLFGWSEDDVVTFKLLRDGTTIHEILWSGLGIDTVFNYLGSNNGKDAFHTVWNREKLEKILQPQGNNIDSRSIKRLKAILFECSNIADVDEFDNSIYAQLSSALNEYDPSWYEEIANEKGIFPPLREFIQLIKRKSLETSPEFNEKVQILKETDPRSYQYIYYLYLHPTASKTLLIQLLIEPDNFWGKDKDPMQPYYLTVSSHPEFPIALKTEYFLHLITSKKLDTIFGLTCPPVQRYTNEDNSFFVDLLLPSDSRHATLGEDTTCCMTFGSQIHNVYTIHGFPALVATTQTGSPFVQGVLTENIWNPEAVSTDAPSQLHRDWALLQRVYALDNLEAHLNKYKKIIGTNDELLLQAIQDYWKLVQRLNPYIRQSALLLGERNTDTSLPVETYNNLCKIIHPTAYTDNTNQTVRSLSGNPNSDTFTVKKQGVQPLSLEDTIPLKELSKSVDGHNTLDHRLYQTMYGSHLACLYHGTDSTSYAYWDETGRMQAYILGYLGSNTLSGKPDCIVIQEAKWKENEHDLHHLISEILMRFQNDPTLSQLPIIVYKDNETLVKLFQNATGITKRESSTYNEYSLHSSD